MAENVVRNIKSQVSKENRPTKIYINTSNDIVFKGPCLKCSHMGNNKPFQIKEKNFTP